MSAASLQSQGGRNSKHHFVALKNMRYNLSGTEKTRILPGRGRMMHSVVIAIGGRWCRGRSDVVAIAGAEKPRDQHTRASKAATMHKIEHNSVGCHTA